MPKSRLIGPTKTPRIWRSTKALTFASIRTATTYHAYVGRVSSWYSKARTAVRSRDVVSSTARTLARHWRVSFSEDTFEHAPSRDSDRRRRGHRQLLRSDVLLDRAGNQQRCDAAAARRDAR